MQWKFIAGAGMCVSVFQQERECRGCFYEVTDVILWRTETKKKTPHLFSSVFVLPLEVQ